jgi:xanthine dehydrogenase YagS FAD-binding subunit
VKPFAYSRAADQATAIGAMAHQSNARFLGGGTNLIDLMRENIEQPDALIDVSRLPFSAIEQRAGGGLRIGAGARNTAVAADARVRASYPVLSQAILCGASGQVRNMATVGGNLMQRTRCYYFYDAAANCNKRRPQSGCDAIDGCNRIHAVLGTSDACIAAHPSDMCVALAALDATVQVEGPSGPRAIPFDEFHRLPGDTPQLDTNLRPDELIVAVDVPALEVAANSLYRKIRDRASFAFALVSVAGALTIKNGVVADVRLALGGVAHKPWRAFEAERIVRHGLPTVETFRFAADAELAAARSFGGNDFKIELVKRTMVGVLSELAGLGGAR